MAIFDVTQFGATGNGVSDDTAAIAAAVAAANASPRKGVVYWPAGAFKTVNLTIAPAQWVSLRGDGSGVGATRIIASGAVQSLVRVPQNYGGTIEGLCLTATGHAIDASGAQQGLAVRDCNLRGGSGHWAFYAPENCFDHVLENIVCGGNGSWTSNGIMLAGHVEARGVWVSGTNIGVLIIGNAIGAVLRHARLEVNKTAVAIGYQPDGVTLGYNSLMATIEDCQFESNGISIDAASASWLRLAQLHILANANAAPLGATPTHGIRFGSVNHLDGRNIRCYGAFTRAAAQIDYSVNGELNNALVANSIGASWSQVPGPSLVGNFRGLTMAGVTPTTLPKQHPGDVFKGETTDRVRLQSVQQVNHLEPSASGKNFCGSAAVVEGATSIAVQFGGAFGGGYADIQAATPATGGTLAPGAYYYLASGVTRGGESRGSTERAVTVVAPNNAVSIACYGTAHPRYKRRIYRGTAPGVYDGYFELPEKVNAFLDVGGPFTAAGVIPPRAGVVDNSLDEPDDKYLVVATPSWSTGVHVTGKAVTGFTLNFTTPAPAGARVDYMIAR